jgi:hypothetical protein
MSLDPLEYLRHILDELEYLMDQSQGLAKEDFIEEDTLKRAFVRKFGDHRGSREKDTRRNEKQECRN